MPSSLGWHLVLLFEVFLLPLYLGWIFFSKFVAQIPTDL